LQEVPLTHIGRSFALSNEPGPGVFCGEKGVFVGAVPLLEQAHDARGPDQWQPRPVSDLNRDLSRCYGLPVEFNRKIEGLAAVARALGRGDLLHAQIATLHLQIPNPPGLTKSAQTHGEIIDLARRLQASGLLKADWDPMKHPRWPAGSPGGIGGEFAPGDSGTGDSAPGKPNAPVIPAQITIPAPFELPMPRAIPFPSEILPAPLVPPNISPRDVPRNPYPNRPECVEEWAQAERFCTELMKKKRLGKGDYRGMGKFYYQCLMGQVSEDCGGNSTSV
jgi:hypothetical protein